MFVNFIVCVYSRAMVVGFLNAVMLAFLLNLPPQGYVNLLFPNSYFVHIVPYTVFCILNRVRRVLSR